MDNVNPESVDDIDTDMEPKTEDDSETTTTDENRTRKLTQRAEEEYNRTVGKYTKKLGKLETTLDYELETYQTEESHNLKTVKMCENRIDNAFSMYKRLSDEYSEYLQRKNTDDSIRKLYEFKVVSDLIEDHTTVIMADIQKMTDRFEETKKIKTETVKSVKTKSARTLGSSSSRSTIIERKVKAEAAKATLKFAMKEAKLKKAEAEMELKKMNLKTDIELLNKEKEAAVAYAEYKATVEEMEVDSDLGSASSRSIKGIPKDNPIQRTRNYVDDQSARLNSQTDNELHLNPNATAFVPNDNKIDDIRDSSDGRSKCASNEPPMAMSEFSRFLLKKDMLLSRFIRFNDQPESFSIWKSSFQTIIKELATTPLEEAELLVKWLGPESSKFAQSIRTSNISDPFSATTKIWKRLEERYGRAEMIETSLRSKLEHFPRISFKDKKKLYDLHDLLSEIQANKENPMYEKLLSYFDTSVGVNPVITKLPVPIQTKWRDKATSYKKVKSVSYPPFSYFVDFIADQASIHNDPGFNFETERSTTAYSVPSRKDDKPKSERSNFKVQVHKTTVGTDNRDNGSREPQNDRKPHEKKTLKCAIHQTNHALELCKAFKDMSIDDKRKVLKENGMCFKCLNSNEHLSKGCKDQVTCDKCDKNHHTLMHIDNWKPRTLPSQGGEHPKETVQSSCIDICKGQFTGRSCAKILPAYVSHKDNPSKRIKVYIILDEQSQTVLSGRRLSGLTITSIDETTSLDLPTIIECDAIPNNREEIPTPEIANFHDHLKTVAHEFQPLDDNAEILLLIGRDLLQAHYVLEQLTGSTTAPFAQRVPLGWVVIGEVCIGNKHIDNSVKTFKTYISPDGRPSLLKPCSNAIKVSEILSHRNEFDNYDFEEVPIGNHVFDRTLNDDKIGKSVEDKLFLEIMDNEFHKDKNGNWCAPLPFKPNKERLPNNYSMALRRDKSLDKNLGLNEEKLQHFKDFMQAVIDDGHAEEAPPVDKNRETWYLPVFGVYHHKKVGKIRCVFDSSAKFGNVSLNKVLLQGPDMNNSLLGVLMRFRKNRVAACADIRQMFYSFSVREDHRDFLRFLWHKDNDITKELITYRMTKHVFGNSPSPAVAIYGLRKCSEGADPDVKDFVNRHFYVDDGLISTENPNDMVSLLQRTQQTLMDNGNIRLHKFASNSSVVMDSLPQEDIAQDLRSLDFDSDDVPLQRSLGLFWNLEHDSSTFSISNDDKPYTRRGILSTLNSVYDPLGIAAPVILRGKLILRKLMSQSVDWNVPLSDQYRLEWETWKDSLSSLQDFNIPRMYLSSSLSQTNTVELHVFADASEKAIASVAYLRSVQEDGTSDIGFTLGKAKVSPQHGHTIPRLELCAAVLAVELAETVVENLDHPIEVIKFYTDSKVVLGYIFNQTRRFYVYVENRVERIRKSTVPSQWNYVPTSINPADLGTRSVLADDLSASTWIHGPITFLDRQQNVTDLEDFSSFMDLESDKEVRPVVSVTKTHASNVFSIDTNISSRFDKFSEFDKLIQSIAYLQRCVRARTWKLKQEQMDSATSVQMLNNAQTFLLKVIQQESYETEIECIRNNQKIPKSSSISSLDPFLDEEGMLRVGGRINKANIPPGERNPLILPGKAHVTRLLVRHIHAQVKHQGRHLTEGALRAEGYWIVGMKRIVSSVIHHCVHCRRLRGPIQHQKMADLPIERVEPAPPFTSVGVDTFGPWNVAHRRTRGGIANAKRWAILFTCLGTRAIHIEVVEELSSSAFINAVRRFVAIRGKVKVFRSDRGTNFVGAIDALHAIAINVEDNTVKDYLTESRTVWIFNPPHASHMGGAWERLIGVTRRILDSILLESKHKFLTHDVLTTFMAEVCSIVNNRPIVPVSTDTDNPFVLSPGILLTQKTTSSDGSDVIGEYDQKDLLRAEWKRVMVLSDMFWTRWRREYLTSLQSRRKWTTETPNVKEGDVVLLRDKSLTRNEWPMGLINRVFPSDDGKVRKLEIRVIREGKPTTYIRPITEIVLLVSS